MLVSSAAGNLCLRLRAPKNQKAMPTVRIVFSVLTMDENNNVLWPQDYAPNTRAALRNLTRAGRVGMVLDPLFPTTVTDVNQLSKAPASDTLWQPAALARPRSSMSAPTAAAVFGHIEG